MQQLYTTVRINYRRVHLLVSRDLFTDGINKVESLSLCSCLNVGDQVPHPKMIKGKGNVPLVTDREGPEGA